MTDAMYGALPGPSSDPTSFNEARWSRVGADKDQIAKLRDAFDAMTPDERVAENARIASLADGDLAYSLDHPRSARSRTQPLATPPPVELDGGEPTQRYPVTGD